MINLSRDIFVLTADEDRLRAAILDAVLDVKDLHQQLHGRYTNDPVQNRNSSFGFLRMYDRQLRDVSHIDCPSRSLKLLMSAVLMTVRQRTQAPITSAFNADPRLNVPPGQYGGLFRGIASMLLYLWRWGHVVLNPYFSPNLRGEELRRYESETLRDLRQLMGASRYLDSDRWNVEQHSKRLFWATDWTVWSQFKLSELAQVHRRWLQAKRNVKRKVSDYPVPPIPFRILLRELNAGLADRVSITKDDLENYARMLGMESGIDDSAVGVAAVDLASLYVPSSKHRDEDAVFTHLAHPRGADRSRARWLGAESVRPGWEDLPIRECGSIWVRLFDDFILDWKQRYESDSKYKSLRPFCDYLFLYLNWWFHKNDRPGLKFPQNPGQVERFVHIKKGAIPEAGERPLTFQEFLDKRFQSAGAAKGNAMRAAMDFFDWVIEEYSGTDLQASFFGDGYKNPIRDKDINYKGAHRRRHARIRLAKRHAELLCDYLLAVEAFFTKLEKDAVECAPRSLPFRTIPAMLEAEEYGFVPIVFHRGKVLPIMDVPAAYHRHTMDFVRSFKIGDHWPNLSALRLLCFMMETGLRGAHIRWLDRNSLCPEDGAESFRCRRIHVNTDKVGSGFILPVSDEAYLILQRQLAAVTRVLDGGKPSPVPYMGREHSRFCPIETLFYRSSATSRHFSVLPYNSYGEIFRAVLAVFGEWLSERTDEYVDLVTVKNGGDISYVLEKSRAYLSEHVESMYTPHSIRSTVISERMSVLPIRLVGLLAGHNNAESTAYYHQVDDECLHQFLNKAPMNPAAWFGFRHDDPGYLQATGPRSALRCAVKRDRRDAEVAFGFTTVTLETNSDMKGEGLTALRVAEDAEIAYFDTHLCPFAGQCPKDIIDELIMPRRCGLCRYAVKSVDHLPAIRAKVRSLESRARTASKRAEQIFHAGSSEEAQRFFDAADMDVMEALGWHLAETVLEQKLMALRSEAGSGVVFHVDKPEMLRRHLVKATLPDSDFARILQRISEANAYPSMQDEEVRYVAARLKRLILGSDASIFEWEDNPVAELCSFLAARMETQGITTTELIRQLSRHRDSITMRRSDGVEAFAQLVRERRT